MSIANDAHLLSACGIPIFNPSDRIDHIVAIDADSEEPSSEEFAAIASFRNFVVRHAYSVEDAEAILDMEFPASQGHQILIFSKRSGLWDCRTADGTPDDSWHQFDLLNLLNLLASNRRRDWIQWKAVKSDVFVAISLNRNSLVAAAPIDRGQAVDLNSAGQLIPLVTP